MDVDTPRAGVHTALGPQRGVNFGIFTSLQNCKTVQLLIFRLCGVHVNGLKSKGVQFCRLVVDVEGYTAVEFLVHCIYTPSSSKNKPNESSLSIICVSNQDLMAIYIYIISTNKHALQTSA